jgi:anhydro-N-acetylmuramic acid kinase
MRKEQLAHEAAKMMASGGGVFNTFLLDCIRKEAHQHYKVGLDVPAEDIIDYKEALLMALMGYLRLKETPNCLPAATGSTRPIVSGALHLGWKRKAAL